MSSLPFLQAGYFPEEALQWRTGDPQEVAKRQVALLRDHVRQARRSPFYAETLNRLALDPEGITSLSDLASLPLTTRADLEAASDRLHAVPKAAIADLALTSGTTTGEPIVVPYTRRDLERLAFNEAAAFWGAGVRPGDRYLVCVTLDRCFVAGLAYFSGLVRLGATAIRSGAGQPARQWELIRRLQPTGIVGVPTFLLKLARWGEAHGLAPRGCGIDRLITIGEPIRGDGGRLNPLGRALREAWGASLASTYASTEIQTCFCECEGACGGHVHPELALVEIVDEAGQPLKDGELGEVVVTPLGVEGLPLLRFRTGDVARLHRGPCSCGWTTPRLGPIEGRLAQRLKFRGTTLYPEVILRILYEIEGVEAAYIEARSTYDLSDDVTVVVGSDTSHLLPKMVADHLQARLRVRPHVVIKRRGDVVAKMEDENRRKQQHFFDLRDGSDAPYDVVKLTG